MLIEKNDSSRWVTKKTNFCLFLFFLLISGGIPDIIWECCPFKELVMEFRVVRKIDNLKDLGDSDDLDQDDKEYLEKKFMEEFGEKVRKARKRNFWIIDDLAEKLDVTNGYISRIERGKQIPGGIMMIRMIKLLSIDLRD